MIHHSHCPVCGQASIQALFSAKDYTVSGKHFPIWTCHSCSALFTQDGPDEQESGAYYQSENYISHSDTRKGIVNRLYHLVRGITLNGKYRVVQRETRKSKGHILDLGCGTGAFLHTMSKNGWDVTGLEPDGQARKKAKELYQLNVQEPAALYELPKGGFDAISLWHVLEHVHDLHKYLDTMRDLLRDEGRIFIAVPNHTSTDAAMYQSYWAAYDVPRHLYHFSPACMKALMLSHGLQVRRILPMWFDAYYVSLLSEQYRGSGAFMRLIKGAWNGLLSNLVALGNKEKCSSLIYVIEKKKA